MFERSGVRQPVGFFGISGFAFWRLQRAMWYWWSVNENSPKYKIENLYENLFLVSQSFMEIAILYLLGNEMIKQVYKIR